jgi:hypothetical protein
MKHTFSEVPRANIQRSSFNRSHGLKTTFDADYLYPVLVDDVVPGDTFNVDMNFFCRLATPLHPIMDNMYLESFFFFVPYRLLWSNWEKMHGAQDNPADSIDFTVPVVSSSTSANMGQTTGFYPFGVYMGLPYYNGVDLSEVTALPFRAYNLIWNEWFRDENLQDSVVENTDNGPDTVSATPASSDYNLLKRGKRHDYFTSCLPWPQKGDAVSLPLSGTAPVATDANIFDDLSVYSSDASADRKLSVPSGLVELGSAAGVAGDHLYADFSQSNITATVNDLRLAFQTQRLLERDARSGTRYNELILSHFGVTVPDFRVQRPEFLGGGSTPINISAVPNTSPVDSVNAPLGSDVNQGDLAAMGTVTGQHGFTKSFTEHGVILGLVNVRGDITYSQGIERYWTKRTRFDFYYPVLAQIGEQAVLSKEIYYGAADPDAVFGYQERYAEYRYKPSRLTGLMAVDQSGTLAAWHLSEDFATEPTLGATFIQSNTGTPLDRAIAVPSQPHFIGDFYFSMKCARPMPLFGVPGNLDHF